jgi:hypothetical protein
MSAKYIASAELVAEDKEFMSACPDSVLKAAVCIDDSDALNAIALRVANADVAIDDSEVSAIDASTYPPANDENGASENA